jgi:hypothetical protein
MMHFLNRIFGKESPVAPAAQEVIPDERFLLGCVSDASSDAELDEATATLEKLLPEAANRCEARTSDRQTSQSDWAKLQRIVLLLTLAQIERKKRDVWHEECRLAEEAEALRDRSTRHLTCFPQYAYRMGRM